MSTTIATPPSRIVFVPWTRNNAGDYAPGTTASQWNEDDAWPRFRYVWQEDLASAPFAFADAAKDVTIYVVGHGGEGVGAIFTLPNGGLSVSAEDLVGNFILGGLKKVFAGRIKFYCCRSADGQEASFACQCASLMRKKGYVHARFYGYTGRITRGYKDTVDDRHRYTDNLGGIGGKHNVRAKHARREVLFKNDEAYFASEEKDFTSVQ